MSQASRSPLSVLANTIAVRTRLGDGTSRSPLSSGYLLILISSGIRLGSVQGQATLMQASVESISGCVRVVDG